jgi:TolA-binding protein
MQDLGKPQEAARLFERLRKEYPDSPFAADAGCRLAQQLLDAKDYQEADKLIDEVLGHKTATGGGEPLDAKVRQYAMFLRGQIAVARADWPRVRTAFEAMVRDYPDGPRTMLAEYWIAEALYRQHDYDAAATRFERLAKQIGKKREPWTAMIALRQAQSLVKRNQWDDAYEIASKIEKDYPGFEQQYEVDYLLGRCLANRAEFDAARQMYNKAIRSAAGAKTETAAMAQWFIGESYFHQKDYENASREFMKIKVLYAYPTWQAGALLQAGKCYQRLGDVKEATKRYREVLSSYPDTSFAKDAAKELARLEQATSRH